MNYLDCCLLLLSGYGHKWKPSTYIRQNDSPIQTWQIQSPLVYPNRPEIQNMIDCLYCLIVFNRLFHPNMLFGKWIWARVKFCVPNPPNRSCLVCNNEPFSSGFLHLSWGFVLFTPYPSGITQHESTLQHASTQLLDINITKLHRYDWHSARLQLLATLWPPQVLICSLWDFQTWLIAMENPPFTDNFPIEMSMFNGFPS